jgi:hypothetical protein
MTLVEFHEEDDTRDRQAELENQFVFAILRPTRCTKERKQGSPV